MSVRAYVVVIFSICILKLMSVRAYVVVGFIIKKLKRKNSVETCKNNPDFIEIIELPNKFESTTDLVKKLRIKK
jgi:hypothetical protein